MSVNNNMANKRHKIKWGQVLFISVMLLYPIFQLIMFWVVPNFGSILSSFKLIKRGRPGQPQTIQFGFAQFKRLFDSFSNPQFIHSLVNSCWYFFTTVIVGVPLTLVLSYFIYKKLFGYKIFRVVFFLPSIISGVVMATLFKAFIDFPNSPFCLLLSKIMNVDPLETPELLGDNNRVLTICIYTLWTGFGVNLVMFNSAMSRVPKDVIEYGKLEGVGMTRELVQIITPLMFPTVVTVLVLGMAGFFTFVQPVMLFRPNPQNDYTGVSWSIAYYILFYFRAGPNTDINNQNYACAVGVFFALLGTPIIVGIKALLDKAVQAVEY